MRLLLDTHTLIWWLEGNGRLSAPAQRAIADEENDVLISAASAWEIATKYRLGKMPSAEASGQRRSRGNRLPGLCRTADHYGRRRPRRIPAWPTPRPL